MIDRMMRKVIIYVFTRGVCTRMCAHLSIARAVRPLLLCYYPLYILCMNIDSSRMPVCI